MLFVVCCSLVAPIMTFLCHTRTRVHSQHRPCVCAAPFCAAYLCTKTYFESSTGIIHAMQRTAALCVSYALTAVTVVLHLVLLLVYVCTARTRIATLYQAYFFFSGVLSAESARGGGGDAPWRSCRVAFICGNFAMGYLYDFAMVYLYAGRV